MKPFLSVIIPVRDDSERSLLTLLDSDKRLSESEYSHEIILVNGNPAPKAADIASRFGRIVGNLRPVDGRGNTGSGWMLRTGMLAARGNYRFFFWPGDSAALGKFEEMLPSFRDGCQILVGGGNAGYFGCFTEEAAVRIFGAAGINGWGFMREISALAELFGLRMKEIKMSGGAKFPAGIHPSVVWDGIRIRCRLRRGTYIMSEKNQ